MDETDKNNQRALGSDGWGDRIEILDLVIAILKHKKLIFGFTAAVTYISLVVVILLPNKYMATAIVMPPQQDQSTATALIGQLIGGSGSASGGIAGALGLKNPNDLYVGMLRSERVADRLIERFRLMSYYDTDTRAETLDELRDKTAIAAGKDGLIKIEFEDLDPRRAAAVANAYVEGLEELTGSLAMTAAAQRRQYFQHRMDENLKSLKQADIALKNIQESTGLIRLDEQAKAIFESMATLRGQIAAKEIELGALRTFATERNPDYLRVQEELAGMKRQLSGLERENQMGSGNILVPTGRIPQAGMQYLERLRDVKYFEAVYEMLAKQVELAKLDEGKNATIIQLVDSARVPDKKTSPPRTLIVVVAALLTACLSLFLALLKEAWDRSYERDGRNLVSLLLPGRPGTAG